MTTSRTIAFALCTLSLALAACVGDDGRELDAGAPSAAEAAAEPAEIAALRQVAERYRDVTVALAEGYIRDPMDMCVTAEMEGEPAELGDMGIHFFRPDLLAITATEPRVAGMGTHTDFSQPAVLIYEPQADGSLELVAIENVVFAAGWEAAGHTSPPSFLGHEYHYMVNDPATDVDEAHGFEPHYELHAWIPRDNPNGMFAQFNPRVSCQHHVSHAGH